MINKKKLLAMAIATTVTVGSNSYLPVTFASPIRVQAAVQKDGDNTFRIDLTSDFLEAMKDAKDGVTFILNGENIDYEEAIELKEGEYPEVKNITFKTAKTENDLVNKINLPGRNVTFDFRDNKSSNVWFWDDVNAKSVTFYGDGNYESSDESTFYDHFDVSGSVNAEEFFIAERNLFSGNCSGDVVIKNGKIENFSIEGNLTLDNSTVGDVSSSELKGELILLNGGDAGNLMEVMAANDELFTSLYNEIKDIDMKNREQVEEAWNRIESLGWRKNGMFKERYPEFCKTLEHRARNFYTFDRLLSDKIYESTLSTHLLDYRSLDQDIQDMIPGDKLSEIETAATNVFLKKWFRKSGLDTSEDSININIEGIEDTLYLYYLLPKSLSNPIIEKKASFAGKVLSGYGLSHSEIIKHIRDKQADVHFSFCGHELDIDESIFDINSFTVKDIENAVKAYCEPGAVDSEIAAQYGITKQDIIQVLEINAYGLSDDLIVIMESYNLTWEQVADMVKDYFEAEDIPEEPKEPDTPSNPENPEIPDEPENTDKPIIVNVKSIKITSDTNKISQGKKITLKATVSPKNATNKKIVWTSSNNKVAKVNSKGIVTAGKNAGGKSVIITATCGTAKQFYKISVVKGVVKKVSITGKSFVKAGKSLKLKAKVKATKKAHKAVKWTSSNTKYATVSSKGVVKTTKAGKGKIVKITVAAVDGSGKKAVKKIRIN